jgi:prevent-host-death family protein
MTTITATDLKLRLGEYLKRAERETFIVTKNGKPAVKLMPAGAVDCYSYQEAVPNYEALQSLRVAEPECDVYDASEPGALYGGDEWMLTMNGTPVARVTPLPKKKKRKLGFIDIGPVSEETIRETMAPIMTDELSVIW